MSPDPATTEPLVYLDDAFVPRSQAKLALHDAGFVLGATVTDLCRTVRGRLYRLADHLDRFKESCTAGRIAQPRSNVELTALAERLAVYNTALLPPDSDLALVFFATPGPIGYYVGEPGGPGDSTPTFGIYSFPLPFTRYAHLFEQGARLVVPSVRQIPSACLDPHIKQRSRLHWWLADREANAVESGSSALLLDLDGFVTETAAANILIVQGDSLVSPPRGTILDGVSLRILEELCPEVGLDFVERPLCLDDCYAATELLLTSTPYCLAGVRSLNGHSFPSPGPIWKRLLTAWSQRIGFDLRRQIFANR